MLPRWKSPGRADPLPAESDAAQLDVPPALSGSGWYRTPNGGWSGAPVSPPGHSPTCRAGHPCCRWRAGPQYPAAPLHRIPARQLSTSWVILMWNAGVSNIGKGTGSRRSETSLSLSNNLDRPRPSPPSPTPCLSRGGKNRHLGSREGDEFLSLSRKERRIQHKLGPAQIDSIPASVNRCLGRSPPVGSSKQESE